MDKSSSIPDLSDSEYLRRAEFTLITGPVGDIGLLYNAKLAQRKAHIVAKRKAVADALEQAKQHNAIIRDRVKALRAFADGLTRDLAGITARSSLSAAAPAAPGAAEATVMARDLLTASAQARRKALVDQVHKAIAQVEALRVEPLQPEITEPDWDGLPGGLIDLGPVSYRDGRIKFYQEIADAA